MVGGELMRKDDLGGLTGEEDKGAREEDCGKGDEGGREGGGVDEGGREGGWVDEGGRRGGG